MTTQTVQVDRADRRALKVPWSALLQNKAHEFYIKATGRRIQGQGMIAADPDKVRSGFGGLDALAFSEYNLPQQWVESRQIPQVLHGQAPRENARILDLGCGPGTSTKVICHFAHESWTVVGYDFTDHYITAAEAQAEAGAYKARCGTIIRPSFVCQDISEPLQHNGQPLPDRSFHLALSGGVVGLYLQAEQCRKLIAELHRVIMPGGYIALDAGPSIPVPELRQLCEQGGFIMIGQAKSFVIEPRPKLIFQKNGNL